MATRKKKTYSLGVGSELAKKPKTGAVRRKTTMRATKAAPAGKGNVIFRRIGGKIVPIKAKAGAAIGAGAAAVRRGARKAAAGAGKAASKFGAAARGAGKAVASGGGTCQSEGGA